ncbi:MAG: hypothetical protein ACE366_23690 [Bradymonadia bacterium]
MRQLRPIVLVSSLLSGCGTSSEEATAPCVSETWPAGACEAPWLPQVDALHVGAEWVFPAPNNGVVEVAVSDVVTGMPGAWQVADRFIIESEGPVEVFARVVSEDCTPVPVSAVYTGVMAYGAGAEQPDSGALSLDEPAFVGWASTVHAVEFGDEVDERFRESDLALGPAEGAAFGVVTLGEGGQITLGFETPIGDGEGPDFAVFENAFNDEFLELAYVEISSDGERFVRFPSAYLGQTPLGPYDQQPPEGIQGLAGKHRAGFGTPFDLSVLRWHPQVVSGVVDLRAVAYVRLVDVVGDGEHRDSFGQPIYDPYPNMGSAGFDLDAVGVLNATSVGECAP